MTHHFLYWLGIGWWCLGLMRASPSSPAIHAFFVFWRLFCTFCCTLLASYGVGCFPIYHSLWLASFGDWALLDHGPSFPRLILCSLRGLVSIFLSYHSVIPAVMLFDSILLDLFWACRLFPSQWLSVFTRPFLTLFASSCVPFPSWASLAHLLSLDFLNPFPILLSYGPLLTLLGFPGPITLYLILGTDGSSISPLLSLLALLWACCGPFLLFYILPMGLFLLSFRAHSSLFASSGPTLWAREPFILAAWVQWLFLAC